MRHRNAVLVALVIVASLFVPPAHAGGSPKSPPRGAAAGSPAGSDGWPATRPGEMGRGWVSAYCAGEDSMRAFLARGMAARSLEDRNVAVRVQKYRDLHDQYGRLQLDSVEESTPEWVTVRLLDADAKVRTFTFTIQDEPPYQLVSVMIRQPMDGLHGLFRGFHH